MKIDITSLFGIRNKATEKMLFRRPVGDWRDKFVPLVIALGETVLSCTLKSESKKYLFYRHGLEASVVGIIPISRTEASSNKHVFVLHLCSQITHPYPDHHQPYLKHIENDKGEPVMRKSLLLILIGLTILSTVLSACAPAKPTLQRFKEKGITDYAGTTASLDAQITATSIRDALAATAKTALKGADVDLNSPTDYRYSVVFAYSMKSGEKVCKGYQVAHDAVLAIDGMKTNEMYSIAIGVFPIPEDIETITKAVCP